MCSDSKNLLKSKNHLIGVRRVVEIYNQYRPEKTGLSNRAILRLHINPELHRPITERTLYNYLNEHVNYKLNRIKELEAMQQSLF